MIKKIICFSIILLFSISLLNITYANDALMTIDNTNNIEVNTAGGANSTVVDNTTYLTDPSTLDSEDLSSDYEDAATLTTTDYEDETELSISNMINIILIVVGVVLILLGIAIIIKLK